MIETGSHTPKVRELLARHGLPIDTVLVIDSIAEWCKQRGLAEDNAHRAGRTVMEYPAARPRILLAAVITDDTKVSVLAALHLYGWERRVVDAIESDGLFFEHLVLHEIAHAIHDEGFPEKCCDEWAFEEMGLL